MTSAHDQLFPDDTDVMRRYQREQAEQEEALTREREAARERSAESYTVRSLRTRVAELERLVGERDVALADALDAHDAAVARIGPWVERLIKGKLALLRNEITEKHGELRGELRGYVSVLDPTAVRAKAAARASEPFKFAGEKVEPEATTGVTMADDAVMVTLPNRLAFTGSGDIH